jgi:predicted Zn-dependent protease
MACSCGNEFLNNILEEYLNNNKNTNKNTKALTKSSVIVKDIPKNPYLSSITGKYAFDLSEISNFSVYFWTAADSETIVNEAIKKTLKEPGKAMDWPEQYTPYVINVLDQYTTFLSKTSSVTSDYGESDIVCVLVDDLVNDKGNMLFGSAYGPFSLYSIPEFVDNKIIVFLNNKIIINEETIKKGGFCYWVLIHEFGHAFGLEHTHDARAGSRIMPGINKDSVFYYQAFAAYGQNSILNTVMSYVYNLYFFPTINNFTNNLTGYSQTLMPLDLLGLRWLYNISGTSQNYIDNYGVSEINPTTDENISETIVGTNRTITFGENCRNISFYFSNQQITPNNILPIQYEYNRILEKKWGFYPKDIASTVSILNFSNTEISNVFIEKDGMKVSLTINLQKNKVFNMYIRDLSTNYTFSNNRYTNKITKLFIQINNNSGSTIKVFFN